MPLQPWRQPFTAPLCGGEFRFNLQKPWSGISTCWSLSVLNKAFLLQPWRDVISLLVHLVRTPVWLVELLKCASTSLSILSPWSWCLYKPFLLSSSADKKTEVQVLTSKWQIQDPVLHLAGPRAESWTTNLSSVCPESILAQHILWPQDISSSVKTDMYFILLGACQHNNELSVQNIFADLS